MPCLHYSYPSFILLAFPCFRRTFHPSLFPQFSLSDFSFSLLLSIFYILPLLFSPFLVFFPFSTSSILHFPTFLSLLYPVFNSHILLFSFSPVPASFIHSSLPDFLSSSLLYFTCPYLPCIHLSHPSLFLFPCPCFLRSFLSYLFPQLFTSLLLSFFHSLSFINLIYISHRSFLLSLRACVPSFHPFFPSPSSPHGSLFLCLPSHLSHSVPLSRPSSVHSSLPVPRNAGHTLPTASASS